MHGITLGFGVTLIGEAVDYAIYLFTQTAPGAPGRHAAADLADAATGDADLGVRLQRHAASSFTGFAQLGLFTIVGSDVALTVTRLVCPPAAGGFAFHRATAFAVPLLGVDTPAGRSGLSSLV